MRTFCFFLVVLLSSCLKEEVPVLRLPEPTQAGANTLGFLRNDTVWVNFGRRCVFTGCRDNVVEAELYRSPSGAYSFTLSAGYNVASRPLIDQSFGVELNFLPAVGVYQPGIGSRNYVQFRNGNTDYRNLDSTRCRISFTRFDTANAVVSGRFEAVLYEWPSGTDSVRIRDGRFDAVLRKRN